MCLAIPGRILQLDMGDHEALVDISGVRRRVNVELLEPGALSRGDWVLIHVGFAMRKVSAAQAREQLRLLAELGEDTTALQEIAGSEGPDDRRTRDPIRHRTV